MIVDEKLILKLEKLSRLSLSDTERESLKKDLDDILKMVEKLEEIDTDQVLPLTHMSETSIGLRQDQVKGQLSVEDALKNAPVKQDPYFKVPTVIDRT